MHKKLLLFLPADTVWGRTLRRGIVIGFFTLISVILKDFIPSMPETYVPIITLILAMLDKWIREMMSPATVKVSA